MEELDDIMYVQAHGRYVYKVHIYNLLNMRSKRQWYQEVKLLSETVEGFAEKYEPFRLKNRVSIAVAKIIIETILEQCGDEITLKFIFQPSNNSSVTQTGESA